MYSGPKTLRRFLKHSLFNKMCMTIADVYLSQSGWVLDEMNLRAKTYPLTGNPPEDEEDDSDLDTDAYSSPLEVE